MSLLGHRKKAARGTWGGGGTGRQSNSAPYQITQRRLLWWFRFFDTWRPLIRPLLVAEGRDKAGGCGWMLVRMKKLCSFPLYCTFVTLTHIDLHYKEARWAICLPPRSLSPRLCVLWVYLWFLCSAAVKKKPNFLLLDEKIEKMKKRTHFVDNAKALRSIDL